MEPQESLGLIWVAIAIVAGVVEVFTLDLIFLMVAGGSLVAALTGVVTGSITLSILAFALATVALLLGARPPLRRYMVRGVPAEAMHTDALVGRLAEVTEAVDAATGRIRLGGEVWSARLEDGEPAVAPGNTVRVLRIDGATAVVRYQHPDTPPHGAPLGSPSD